MATYVYEQQEQQYGSSLQQRNRSQSDSNLLGTSTGDITAELNGSGSSAGEGPIIRMGSVGDLSPGKPVGVKKKGFLYRLVRPWKWKKKKRFGGKDHGKNERELKNVC